MLRQAMLAAAAALLCARAAQAQTIVVGRLTLTPCITEYGGYCGSLTRALDPSGKVPGTIEIGFEFYPRTQPGEGGSGTIAAQEGGPGYSTTGSRDGYVRLFTPLRTRRNIVLIDKRGTGRSGAIHCRALQAGKMPEPAAIRACGNQLGASAWLFGSALAADDMAAVLDALETGPVDYYGDSYATFFGQVFATRHPGLLRTVVLDSAYPVLGGTPFFQTEIENGKVALLRVCERAPACRALPSSVNARFDRLLASLRANPVHGVAPNANGGTRAVTAGPASLFLVFYEVGNNLIAYRDLDAAGRAWLDHGDALPLLRLVAEAYDASAGAEIAAEFDRGLATAVMCQDYHTLFDLRVPEDVRRRQFAHAIEETQARDPGIYAPFRLADALAAPTNPEALDSCLAWPAPVVPATPGLPVPQDARFPPVPVLVLAGELDTVTSPVEAAQTAALFPNARLVLLRNTGHETAVGDGGVFVPPNGADLAGCAGPIVLAFVASGGEAFDPGCAAHVRPLRPVTDFARAWSEVAPATPADGNAVGQAGLRLASAVAETVGDAVARYYVTTSGSDLGLRGGRWHLRADARGYRLFLEGLRWTNDLAVSGTIAWNQLDGHIQADVTLAADGHAGTLAIAWEDRGTGAVAHIVGQIDGEMVVAERGAP